MSLHHPPHLQPDSMPSAYVSHTCLFVGEKPPAIDPDATPDELGGETIYADKLWNNGEKIEFTFFGPYKGTPRQQKIVRDAIAEWLQYTNVTFTEKPDTKDQSAGVRISFKINDNEAKRASWAALGKEAAMEVPSVHPTVNIAWIDGGTDEELKDAKAVVLHQIGHVLGLGHEFGRGVKLNREYMEMILARKPNQWSKDDVDRGLFQVIQKGDITNFPAVDDHSIMKYYMPAVQNEDKLQIPPNPELSEKDKAFMRINYPHLSKQEAIKGSMTALNFDATAAGNILNYLKNGDIAGVREDYVKYVTQAGGI